jgi:hypothetical protein
MEKEIKTTDNKAAINRLTKYMNTIKKYNSENKDTKQGKGGRK